MWKRYMLAVLLFTSCMYLRPKQNSMSDLSQNDWAEGLEATSEAIVLDVRTEEEFESGYIPNAINIPFADFINKNGTWKSLEVINKIWNKTRINPHDEWGVMCGSGVTACHLAISALLVGMNEPSLYVGSWSEWIASKTRPITTNE